MNNEAVRTIPQPVRREVRRRCGFGCVICGSPIYHYDHMMDWAIYRRHNPDEITLLCPTHHQEKNSGLLSITTIEKHNRKPFNKNILLSPKWKLNYYREIQSVVGGMVFNTVMPHEKVSEKFFTTFLQIGPFPIIWFNIEEGNLLLNAVFYRNGVPIFVISDNEFVYSTEMWDIEFVGRTLTVREAHRKIMLKITFDVSNNQVIFNQGDLRMLGREITIREEYVRIKAPQHDLKISGGYMSGVKVGIQC